MQKVRILQVRRLQNLFHSRRTGAVEMHSDGVDQQANRGLTLRAARVDRPQEGILNPDQRQAVAGGQRFATPSGWAAAPDQHAITGAREAKVQLMPGKVQHPVQLAVAKKRQVLVPKPPWDPSQTTGVQSGRAQFPYQSGQLAVLAMLLAAPVVPVIAPSVFCHCTNGASVT